MLKYVTLLKLFWQNGFVYRTSLLLWRFRNFLASLMSLTVWSVIYTNQSQFLTYQKDQMIGYIFLIAVLQSLILSSTLHSLASDIYNGHITNILLKPMNFFYYLITNEVADKLKNFAFVLIEVLILFLIFNPVLIIPNLTHLILFIISIFIGLSIFFLVLFLLGTIGFWSPETWAPRFLLFVFIDFTSGKLFPLDILPLVIQKLVYLTPFPYFSYVQTQIYLGKLSIEGSLRNIFISSIWLIILALSSIKVWKKGIKEYTAVGR